MKSLPEPYTKIAYNKFSMALSLITSVINVSNLRVLRIEDCADDNKVFTVSRRTNKMPFTLSLSK